MWKPTLTLKSWPRNVSATAAPSGPATRSSGSSGSGARRCEPRKSASSSTPPAAEASTSGSPQPDSGPRVSASESAASAAAHANGATPNPSRAVGGAPGRTAGGGSAGTRFRSMSQVSRPSGTLTRKIQRHDAFATSRPPSGGPTASPTPTMAPNAPSARPRCSNGNACTSSAEPFPESSAAPTPWTTRSTTSASTVGAAPQSPEAAVKSRSPAP